MDARLHTLLIIYWFFGSTLLLFLFCIALVFGCIALNGNLSPNRHEYTNVFVFQLFGRFIVLL